MTPLLRALIPQRLFRFLAPYYHLAFAFGAAHFYGFPSRKLFVIGVTGTKGKSSTAELINALLEEAGFKTALAGTIRFKIGAHSLPNTRKMTMPGRHFLQKFLHDAARENCRFAIIEMTSQGVLEHRHRYIDLNALVFTNLKPEHIESHGSFEAYAAAKLLLRDALHASPKIEKYAVANIDDPYGHAFLSVPSANALPYSLKNAEPYHTTTRGVLLTVEGLSIHSPLIGIFNIYNILAAFTLCRALGVSVETAKRALERFERIAGRAERIEAGQPFTVIVDYAHTPDSLEKLYQAFKDMGSGRRICVLGNTGGGRDTWKRPIMGEIADTYCNTIILTDEDPYDEDPHEIVRAMERGIKKHKPLVILDRREAIDAALKRARAGDAVLITGKGTDPYLMGPRGKKTPWSDAALVRELIAQSPPNKGINQRVK